MTTLVLRRAEASDVPQMVDVLRRSIAELCVADHQNREGPLAQWLENKTVHNVAQWVANTDAIMLVAMEGNEMLSVGCIREDGYVALNYVSPDARFRGISKAMMAALENEVGVLGGGEFWLESSLTARTFYLSIGYGADGEAGEKHGLPYFPMRKVLPK